MPGRQAHGRSLMAPQLSSSKRHVPKSKFKAQAHVLDALAIAAKQVQPERLTRRGRTLDLDQELQNKSEKHRRDEDQEGDYGGAEDEEGSRKKRLKRAEIEVQSEEDDSAEQEGGSDSEGHEWHMGVEDDDEDSDIDSDEAFGESDEEKFESFTFRGSRSRKQEEEEDDEDDESLGGNAIDLAQALDQGSDDDDEESNGDTESGPDEDEEDEDDGDEDDPAKVNSLQNIIQGFADNDNKVLMNLAPDETTSPKQAVSLQDLGLSSVKDPLIKKSVKLMKREERAGALKNATSQKLDIPLPKRQEDQLLRVAAYEKTNETLDRWNDTVKYNRRADHLFFPLAHTSSAAALNDGEVLELQKAKRPELEQAIASILEESGLGSSAKHEEKEEKKKKKNKEKADSGQNSITQAELKELWAQRRKERDVQSREQARAKRIKKIKSKAYRKIHRKERLGEEAAAHEALAAAGEINSDEEREAAHRRRALERVGARHKESKWARMAHKTGRAVWDDDFREALTDMARKDEELRRQLEGKTGHSANDEDESDGANSSGNEDAGSTLLQELDRVDDDNNNTPQSNLMKLKFMQKAEAQRKKINDELVSQIRRDLTSGHETEDDEDRLDVDVGRRAYGRPKAKTAQVVEASTSSTVPIGNGSWAKSSKNTKNTVPAKVASSKAPQMSSIPGASGVWSRAEQSGPHRRKEKKIRSGQVAELDQTNAVLVAEKQPSEIFGRSKATSSDMKAVAVPVTTAFESDEEDATSLPLAIRDQELIARAFAGEDVVGEFEAEKEAIISEDEEKIVDNTLPGWGSWVGEGISKRAQKRNKGKVMTKKDGIKRKDRKDAKLQRVIINEKRVRKNDKYLAPQLPHPFESKQQYERSLRLPIGQEWMTKESFQEATKPRVIIKQGIIAPMAKPII